MVYTTYNYYQDWSPALVQEHGRESWPYVPAAACSGIAAQQGDGWGSYMKQTAVSQYKMIGEDGACIIYR